MVGFLAPMFGVYVANIKVVFDQENVRKQLCIRSPTKLAAVFLPNKKPKLCQMRIYFCIGLV